MRGRSGTCPAFALTAALLAAAPGWAAQVGPRAMEPLASAEAGDARRSRGWMSFGFAGAALPEDVEGGFGLLAALTYQRGPHHVALRGMGFADVVSGYDDSVIELAALYGRTRTGALGHAAAAAGLAVVTVDRGSPHDVRTTVGIPLTPGGPPDVGGGAGPPGPREPESGGVVRRGGAVPPARLDAAVTRLTLLTPSAATG